MASVAPAYARAKAASSGKGFTYTSAPVTASGTQTTGQKLISDIASRGQLSQQQYKTSGDAATQKLALDVVGKSAGNIPVDEWGIPTQELTNYQDIFNSQLASTKERGQLALQTVQAQQAWKVANAANQQAAQYQADLAASAGLTANLPAGASSNNPGARAVALAMSAYNNHTPYVWGGNSLKNGVDCSGLVQQVYKQLGISVPRSTYEQAKAGKHVSLGALLPGDLVFFNTGKNDPNGIGVNGHVGIYIGNGKMVNAKGTKYGITIASISGASGAVRPW